MTPIKEKSTDFILLDADYEIQVHNGISKPLIRLWGRSNGKRVEIRVKNFLPYFYADAGEEQTKNILAKNGMLAKEWVLQTSICKKRVFFGGVSRQLTQLVGNIPYQVPKIRKYLRKAGIVVHEADIPFTRRFLIDRDLRALHFVQVTGKIVKEEDDVLILETSYENLSQKKEVFEYRPVLLAFDIEVDEQGETIHELLLEKKRRITAISFAWGTIEAENPDSKVLILKEDSDNSEIELLSDFIKTIHFLKPDVLVSFNGTFFDIPYLATRMSKYGMSLGKLAIFEDIQDEIIKTDIPVESYRLKGRAIVDLMPRTWHIHPISGKKSLDSISKEVLGESKVQLKKSLGELWRNSLKGIETDTRLFVDYSLKDAILTFRLMRELGVGDSIELCRLSGYPLPEGILSTSRQIGELELMRILFTSKILIPSKPNSVELRKRTEYRKKYPHLGGWVIDPLVDEATFVAILDFRSLYPNIVRTNNISGETMIPNSDSFSPERRFRKEPRGALAVLMDRILYQRYQIQAQITAMKNDKMQRNLSILEKRQRALKLMANSVLGASNYPRGRFYHHIISNSITAIARELLSDKLERWTTEFSEAHPFEVLLRYGDTDSIFVEFVLPNLHLIDFHQDVPSKTKELNQKRLLEAINTYRSFLSQKLPEFLELQLEDVALRIILKKGRKKAYSYVSLLSGNIIIRGFEAIRSDWSPLARKAQRKLLESLLTDLSDNRREQARRVIFNLCRFILTSPVHQLIEEITIRGPLRRSPHKYRSKTPAVGAFLHYCRQNGLDPDLEWKKWDGFPYIIARSSSNEPQYIRAYHPSEFRDRKKRIDRWHYVREIIGASIRFGIQLKESEAQQGALIIPLTTFFGIN